MTKTIAKEWGQFGVRCNCIAFGLIDTRLTRAKEVGFNDLHLLPPRKKELT